MMKDKMTETKELTMKVRIKESFDLLYKHQRDLTASQIEFIHGCRKHFKRNKNLSEKQTEVLFTMVKYMNNGAL